MGKRATYNLMEFKIFNTFFTIGQLDIILEALILYKNTLEHVMREFKLEKEEKNNKVSQIIFIYEQIQALIREQNNVNNNFNYEKLPSNLELKDKYKLNSTEIKIIKLISTEKYITEQDLAKILELSPNCIYKNLRKLRIKSLVDRVGSNKNGFWRLKI